MTTLNNIYAQILNPELFDQDLFTHLVKNQDKQVLKDLFVSPGFLEKFNLTKSNENLLFILDNLYDDMPSGYGINSVYLVEKLSQIKKLPSHLKLITPILTANWSEDISQLDIISYRKENAILRFNQKEINDIISNTKLNPNLNRKMFHLYLMTKDEKVLSKVNQDTLLNNWNQEDDTLFKSLFAQKSVHAMAQDKIFVSLLKEKTLKLLSDPQSLFNLFEYNVSKKQISTNYTMFFNTVGFNFKKDCSNYTQLNQLILDNESENAFNTLSLLLELGLKVNKTDLNEVKVEKYLKLISQPNQTNHGMNVSQELGNRKAVLSTVSKYAKWNEKNFKQLLNTYLVIIEKESINGINDYLGKKTAFTLLIELINEKPELFKMYPQLITHEFKKGQDLISIFFKANKVDTVIKLVEYGANVAKLYKDKKGESTLIDLARNKKSKTYQSLVITLEKIQFDKLLVESDDTQKNSRKLKI